MGYQGRVQPIRYLLKYVNFSYTEKLYFEHDDWEKVDKAAFGENAKLPYLKVDDETIVYGEVEILDHLGEKFGLVAKSDEEIAQRLDAVKWCEGIMNGMEDAIYDPVNFVEKVAEFERSLPALLAPIDHRLKTQNGLTGSRLNTIDFSLFHLLNLVTSMVLGSIANLKALQNFRAVISKNWWIQDYSPSLARQKFPYFSESALWG